MREIKTPVCLLTWKRWDTVERIISVLRMANVKKIYVKSDCWRNEEEKELVLSVRDKLKSAFNWDCETLFQFEDTNQGVFNQIGIGALKIFDKEDTCIFIEDDNLPTVSFFQYCEELLDKYKDNDRVLMIAGTNYSKEWEHSSYDYMFVKALLPCGWASWSHKFKKYYDTKLDYFDDQINRKKFLSLYKSKALAKQQLESICSERTLYLKEHRFRSWDYHLIASIMRNDLLVISPSKNQIRNIGIDDLGIHNAKNYKKNPMTKRFCEIEAIEMSFPLKHPLEVDVDSRYQRYCDSIITIPLGYRIKRVMVKILKKMKLHK